MSSQEGDSVARTLAALDAPDAGNLRLIVMLGETGFVAWNAMTGVEAIIDEFERVASQGEAGRSDEIGQMKLRLEIVRRLRLPNVGEAFQAVLASGCLWLALRHWSKGQVVRDAIDAQMNATGYAVLTITISDSPGSLPDTAWAFMVADRFVDARERLALQPPGAVSVVTSA